MPSATGSASGSLAPAAAPAFAGTNRQGSVAAVPTGCAWVRGGRINELYSYNYGYDDEGKPLVTTYDAMARPNSLTQQDQPPGVPDWFARTWVSGVSYGIAGAVRIRSDGLITECYPSSRHRWSHST